MSPRRDPRVPAFAEDPDHERAIEALGRSIQAIPEPAEVPAAPQRPLLFVVGVPRSGTTLLHQLLARLGTFGYVSNLIARFPANPRFGALVQSALAPTLPAPEVTFASEAGNTEGWAGPHEFGYFWHRHLPFEAHHQPSADALAQVDLGALARRLAGLESALGRPLVLKNPVLDYVLPALARALPTASFVNVRRDPVAVAASILAMRERHHGSREAWWSIRPVDAAAWRARPYADQIAYQLASVEAALAEAAEAVGPDRWLEIPHARLCAAPRDVVRAVCQRMGERAPVDLDARVPSSFPLPAARPVDDALAPALRARGLIA